MDTIDMTDMTDTIISEKSSNTFIFPPNIIDLIWNKYREIKKKERRKVFQLYLLLLLTERVRIDDDIINMSFLGILESILRASREKSFNYDESTRVWEDEYFDIIDALKPIECSEVTALVLYHTNACSPETGIIKVTEIIGEYSGIYFTDPYDLSQEELRMANIVMENVIWIIISVEYDKMLIGSKLLSKISC